MLKTEQLYNPEKLQLKAKFCPKTTKNKNKKWLFFCSFFPLQHLKVCHPRLLSSLLMAHLHRPALAYLSIHLHLPFLYPPLSLSLSVRVSFHLRSLSFSPPTCGFALHPSVLRPSSSSSSSSSSSLIPRSHMVSLSWSVCVCVWCYPEFTGAPCSYVCVLQTEIDRQSVCVCVCVLGRVQQGSSRLCNTFICRSCRGRLHLLFSFRLFASFSSSSVCLFMFIYVCVDPGKSTATIVAIPPI